MTDKIELITWIDSYGCSAGWEDIDIDEITLVHAKSVGYIVAESDEYIVVVPHIAEFHSKRQGCGDMTIPKVAIVDRVILKEAENETT